MKTIAKIVSQNGQTVTLKVERMSMCDGCASRKGEGCSCSHSLMLDSDSSMKVEAVCHLDVSVGDVVEIESRDGRILLYGAVVFIFPLAVLMTVYTAISKIIDSIAGCICVAMAAFALSFILIRTLDRKHRSTKGDITVTRVISHCEVN